MPNEIPIIFHSGVSKFSFQWKWLWCVAEQQETYHMNHRWHKLLLVIRHVKLTY